MNRIAVKNIVLMGVGLGIAFGISKFVLIYLDLKDVWPLNNSFTVLLGSCSLVLLIKAFTYSIKSMASVEEPNYYQSFIIGIVLGFPLRWLLASVESIF